MQDPAPPLPSFLIIGAQKAGTRWLRFNLGLHPKIFALPREPMFFDNNYKRGARWYREQFEGWTGEPVVGEATPGYLLWGRNAKHRPWIKADRIVETLPNVRLFAVLRDPTERLLSAFLHHISKGRIPAKADLFDYLKAHDPEGDPLQLVSGGWYAASLAPYLDRFGDRLEILLNENIRDDPKATYDNALVHLGLEPDWRPSELGKVRFSTPIPREGKYSETTGRPQLTPRDRRILFSYFEDDIKRLEQLIGRDLSHWRHT
jgi:hypothetical protein